MTTMMRVKEPTLADMKVLKKVKGYKSYDELVDALVSKELIKTHASTQGGYLAIGTVVTSDDATLIITDVTNGMVYFNDGTFYVNGGGPCSRLVKFADAVADLEE